MDDKETPKPNEGPALPSMFQMIKSFSKEVIDYIKQGAPNVTAADYAERLDTCTACPHIIKKNMRCSLCGCAMQHKAKWTTSKCPDNPSRWKKQIIKDQNGNIIDEKTIEENLKRASDDKHLQQSLKKRNEQRQKNDNTNISNKV